MVQQGMVGVTYSIDTQDWRLIGKRAVIENALAVAPAGTAVRVTARSSAARMTRKAAAS